MNNNAEFSGYYFYMKMIIKENFQIRLDGFNHIFLHKLLNLPEFSTPEHLRLKFFYLFNESRKSLVFA